MSLDFITVLAVLFIWLMMPPLVREYLQPTAEPSLRNVQILCVTGSLSVLGIGLVLFVVGQYRPHELGISLKQWPADLRVGSLGYLASFAPIILILVATAPLRSEATLHPLLKVLRLHPQATTILWMILVAVVIAPLLEELLFRVVLQGALTKRIGPTWSIPLVAVAFSAVHSWPDSLALIPLALVLGYVYHRRHSYLAVVVLHAIFNATNLVFALLAAENAPAGS